VFRETARALRAMAPRDTLTVDPKDPKGVAARLALAATDPAALRGLYAAPLADDAPGLPKGWTSQALDALANAEVVVEGSAATGWRARITPVPLLTQAEPLPDVFLVLDRGTVRIRAWAYAPAELGAEALDRLHHKDEAGARVWLGWAAPLLNGGGSDPLSGAPFTRIWTGPGTDAARLEVAAAALMGAEDARSEQALAVLQKAHPIDDAVAVQVLRSTAEVAARRSQGALVQSSGEALAAKFPDALAPVALEAGMLERLGQRADAVARLTAFLEIARAYGLDPEADVLFAVVPAPEAAAPPDNIRVAAAARLAEAKVAR
jgi:hypothetical protein